MSTKATNTVGDYVGSKPTKRVGKWHGRTKDVKKAELVLKYHAEHPDAPYREIAEVVGVAEVTAYNALKKHGLILPHKEAQHRRKSRNEKSVLAYYHENPSASIHEISEAAHLAPTTIRKILLANNIALPKTFTQKPDKTAKKKRLILEYKLAHPGASNREIAEKLRCSRTYVYVTLSRRTVG